MYTKTSKLIVTFLLTSFLFAGCGTSETPPNENPDPSYGEEVHSQKDRVTSPNVSQSNMETQVAGNSSFTFDLYHAIKTSNENMFFSPHSISTALAMVYAGAKNTTEQEMAQVLHYDLAQQDLHPMFNYLDLELNSRGQGAQGADGKGFRLNVSNAIWGQKGYQFMAPYLDTLATNYGAGLRLLDFINQLEQSRLTINSWVENETEGRIKDLLQKNDLDETVRLVLTNTIYFNAAWKSPFDPLDTANGSFRLLDNSTVNVSMMSGTQEHARYASGTDYEAVEVPYDGDELSMLFIMPEHGTFASFEQSLSSTTIDSILQQLSPQSVYLSMPKFEFEARKTLKDAFSSMGMEESFTQEADFSNINGGIEPLWIGDVIHKAFIKVDEAGTEAAAATAVVMVSGGLPQIVALDRPFIFLIRDHKTNAILFVGRVINPNA